MKILAIERETPGLTSDDFKPYLEQEAKMVWRLYEQGIVREIYFGKEEHNAHLVLECDSIELAIGFLDELPLVKNNLINFELTTLIPYNGFNRLFSE